MVKIGGVSQFIIGTYVVDKAESPWLASGTAINLMIHEVANADECSHESDGDAQAVEGPEHIKARSKVKEAENKVKDAEKKAENARSNYDKAVDKLNKAKQKTIEAKQVLDRMEGIIVNDGYNH